MGADISIEQARTAAELWAMNALVVVGGAVGGNDGRLGSVPIFSFIRCVDDFAQHLLVLEGASDVLPLFLGDRGDSIRAVLGADSLSRQAPVETENPFEVLR
ncbi:MAG: hypothetical protein ABWY30_08575 [Microterricola sp.]